METLLVKIFAAGLALSQVTRRLQDARRGLERAEEVFPSEALGRPARSLQRYSPRYHSAVPVGGHQGTGVTEYWVGTAALVRLDVGRPDYLAPLVSLFGDQLAEVGRRARK